MYLYPAAAAAAKSLQSCPTLFDPVDGSPPGSPVLGISRQEHWSGLSFPSPMHESEKWKVKVKSLSHIRPSATPRTAAFQAPPSMGFSRQEYWSEVPLPSPREFNFTLKDIWPLPLTLGDYLLWNAMPDRSIWPQQIKADVDRIERPMMRFRLGLWVLKYHLKWRLRSTRGQVEPQQWLNTEAECLGGLPWFTMPWFPETLGNCLIWIPAKQHILIAQREDYGSSAFLTSLNTALCVFFFSQLILICIHSLWWTISRL